MDKLLEKIISDHQSFVIYKLHDEEHFVLIYGDLTEQEIKLGEENYHVNLFEGENYAFKNHNRVRLTSAGLDELFRKTDFINLLPTNETITSTTEKDFTDFVDESLQEIATGKYHKIVPSKVKVKKNHIGSIPDTLRDLNNSYPETLTTLFFSPQLGCWLGTSPEILLIGRENELKTTALAGTQLAGNLTPKQASWSQKEIEEQAFVSRYIIDCFKIIRLREYTETGPKTMQTGKLFHLKTDYTINKNDTRIKELEQKLIDLLNPTSAVCGMPKDVTKPIILDKEKHKRSLYTGFWGPTMKNGFRFYVNIRLAQVFKNHLVFYAGAGITEDSHASSEWKETEAKCDNLSLKLLD